MEGILALLRWLDPPVFGGVLLLIFLVFWGKKFIYK
jgi:hypothetical protein